MDRPTLGTVTGLFLSFIWTTLARQNAAFISFGFVLQRGLFSNLTKLKEPFLRICSRGTASLLK